MKTAKALGIECMVRIRGKARPIERLLYLESSEAIQGGRDDLPTPRPCESGLQNT